MLNIEATAGDGNVDELMLIKLPAVGMDRAEDAHFDTQPACPFQHGTGGAAEQVIEPGPVIVKERPEQVWHGKGDVSPLTVG